MIQTNSCNASVLITWKKHQVASPTQNAERVISMFKAQAGFNIGFPVDLYTHGLQTATLALRDGCDEETVVCALLHDLGECWSSINHGEIAASLLRPYISPENYWVLNHHEVFQAYIYKNGFELKDIEGVRNQFKESPHFDACARFCERYDSKAFDPDYDTLPLEHFIPMIIRIFNRKPYVESGCLNDAAVNVAKFSLCEAYPNAEENWTTLQHSQWGFSNFAWSMMNLFTPAIPNSTQQASTSQFSACKKSWDALVVWCILPNVMMDLFFVRVMVWLLQNDSMILVLRLPGAAGCCPRGKTICTLLYIILYHDIILYHIVSCYTILIYYFILYYFISYHSHITYIILYWTWHIHDYKDIWVRRVSSYNL